MTYRPQTPVATRVEAAPSMSYEERLAAEQAIDARRDQPAIGPEAPTPDVPDVSVPEAESINHTPVEPEHRPIDLTDPAVDAVVDKLNLLRGQQIEFTADQYGVLFAAAISIRQALNRADKVSEKILQRAVAAVTGGVAARAIIALRTIDSDFHRRRMIDLHTLAVTEGFMEGDEDPTARGRAATAAYAAGLISPPNQSSGGVVVAIDLDAIVVNHAAVAARKDRRADERVAEIMTAGLPRRPDTTKPRDSTNPEDSPPPHSDAVPDIAVVQV